MNISLTHPCLQWHGTISLEETPGGVQPWRLDCAKIPLYHPDLVNCASFGAGVRLRFRSSTSTLALPLTAPNPETTSLDVLVDGKLTGTFKVGAGEAVALSGLGTADKLIEIYLPTFGRVEYQALVVDDGASVSDPDPLTKRWVTYGSSITMCRTAHSASRAWPALVARRNGFDLTCLGFGGQCHLDTLMARHIRDLDADFISLAVGINIQGQSSLGPRAFFPAITGFVQIIREKHPDTPIALISPICSPPREEQENLVGFSLVKMRREVRHAAEALQECGDDHVHYIDGLSIFGPELVDHMPDLLHPNGHGYEILAENFQRQVVEAVFA